MATERPIEEHRLVLVGQSGKRYPFTAQPLHYRIERAPGVIIVTRCQWNAEDRDYRHSPIYIDEVEDLSSRIDSHPRKPYFEAFGANCLGYLRELQTTARRLMIRDLKECMSWPATRSVEELDAMISAARKKTKPKPRPPTTEAL